MIRADMGKVEMEGTILMLLAELTTICAALKENIMEVGMSEEKAKEHIQECLDMAFMSEVELDKQTRRAMVEIFFERIGVKDGIK